MPSQPAFLSRLLFSEFRSYSPAGSTGSIEGPRDDEHDREQALWIVQGLLALLFLFAGGMKLVLPIEEVTAQMPVPISSRLLRRDSLPQESRESLVLLPSPGDLTFYDRVTGRTGEAVQLTGHVVPWPTHPQTLGVER